MSNLIVRAAYQTDMQKQAVREPSERYAQYYHDLYKLYDKKIDNDTFYSNHQFNYSMLGEAVLNEVQLYHDLSAIRLLLCVFWSHEYDPDHISCAAYLTHQYQMKPTLFDICDHGSISSVMGFRLLMAYFEKFPSDQALMLAFEQTTIPRCLEDHVIMPSQNAAIAMIMSSQCQPGESYIFLEADIIHEARFLEKSETIVHFLESIREKYCLDLMNLEICFKRTSYLWKSYHYYYQTLRLQAFRNVFVRFLEVHPSALTVLSFISDLVNKKITSTKSYVLIFDEDEESLNCGMILLKKG